jgi:hypothetical protein
MVLQKSQNDESCGYAHIFIDVANRKVHKLFKSFEHPDHKGEDIVKEWGDITEANNFNKKVFETERDAYINVQQSVILKKFTPTYYGIPLISQVIDERGIDISNHYLLDCCIAMEYIPGENMKLTFFNEEGHLKEYSVDYNELVNEFNNCGVKYLTDAQVIYNEDFFIIVDFGIVDPITFELIL